MKAKEKITNIFFIKKLNYDSAAFLKFRRLNNIAKLPQKKQDQKNDFALKLIKT
jgi:hypothetical protein